MSKKYNLYFILIIVLSLFLRFIAIGDIPRYISSDESALGYNAFALLTTGKDEFGNQLPITFKSFGEYKAPLFIYSLLPAIFVFGLSESSIRLTSAIYGIVTVIGVYYLVREYQGKRKNALLASLVISVLPWHLQFSRIAYEGNAALAFMTWSMWAFVKYFRLKKSFFLNLSVILSVFVVYSHYVVRLLLPLIWLVIIKVYLFPLYQQSKKLLFISVLIGVFLILPLVPSMLNESGLGRAGYISIFTDSGTPLTIEHLRVEHSWNSINNPIFNRLAHNKLTEMARLFIYNYLAHYDITYFSLRGDSDSIFNTPNTGPVLVIFIPLLLFGLYSIITSQNRLKHLILAWFLLSPVPSSLTRLGVSTNRTFMMVVPLAIIIGYGMNRLVNSFKQVNKKAIMAFLCIVFFVEYVNYFDSYYAHSVIKNVRDSRLGRKDLIHLVQQKSNPYEKVWITPKTGGYIHFLFFMKYPADLFQTNYKTDNSRNEFGFISVDAFDKYFFKKIPRFYDFSQNTLYVAEKGDVSFSIEFLAVTYYPDGQAAFVLYDTEAVRRGCPECDIQNKPDFLNIYGEEIKYDQTAE